MIVANPLPDVSIVVPAHNEAENLPTLIHEMSQAMKRTDYSYEIVVIDDCSEDKTPSLIEEIQQTNSHVVYYRMKKRCGQSGGLSAGFDVARGEYIVTIDADLQNDPADIPALLANLNKSDVSIGWRKYRKDPISKKIISKVANFIRNWATGECVKDTGCGLKAFKRESLEKIHRFDGMHRFFPTLVKMHGYTVSEVPVNHRPRTKGRTHYNIFNRSIRPICDLMAIRWLQKRTLRYQLSEEKILVRK